MEIGKVYEVIPMFQMTFNGVNISGFYGRFIGYDSSGKCVFEQDGKYRGYWETGTRESIFDTAKIVPLTAPQKTWMEEAKEHIRWTYVNFGAKSADEVAAIYKSSPKWEWDKPCPDTKDFGGKATFVKEWS